MDPVEGPGQEAAYVRTPGPASAPDQPSIHSAKSIEQQGAGSSPTIERVFEHEHGSRKNPAWYTPLRVLLLFSYVMTLTWVDQGAFASNGVQGDWPSEEHPEGEPGMVIDLNINPFQDGVLAAMYCVGLIIASFVFAVLAGTVNEFRLIGIGLFVWVCGSLGTAGAQSFVGMIFARILAGAGEASVMTLSFPFVDDCAPSEHKTLWFGVLALCQPVGVAIGFAVGGSIASALDWRKVFYITAAAALPIMAFCLLAPAVSLKGGHSEPALGLPQTMQHHDEEDDEAGVKQGEKASTPFMEQRGGSSSAKVDSSSLPKAQSQTPSWWSHQWHHFKILFDHPVFWFNNFGAVPVEFALQAMSYYGPRAGKSLFSKDGNEMDITFGALAVGAGVLGSLGGGFLLDRCGSSVKNGFGLQTMWTTCGTIFFTIAFAIPTLPYPVFVVFIALGLLCLMAMMPVSDALSMWTIPAEQRPISQAIMTICIRSLGDLPASPIIGAIQQSLDDWRGSMLVAVEVMAVAIILYLMGYIFSKHHPVPDDFDCLLPDSNPPSYTMAYADSYNLGHPSSKDAGDVEMTSSAASMEAGPDSQLGSGGKRQIRIPHSPSERLADAILDEPVD